MESSIVLYIVSIAIAYLIGAIPTGIIVTKIIGGVDPRKSGSGNIGATNVGRTSGKKAGAITLLGDAVKGAAPVLAAFATKPEPLFVSLVAVAAFLGHLFPVYLGFKGGKGVATALGVMVVICPLATIICAVIFGVVVKIKKYVSLASMTAAASLPIILSLTPRGKPYVMTGAVISVLVILKHTSNIKRLIAGEENRIK